jgi:predicted nucleic acid-binding protein
MPDRPAVLLSDANVLIDYRDSDLAILALVVQHLAPVHVLRDVVDEVDDLSLARCGELGLRVIEVGPETLLQLEELPRRLSRYDRLSLHVCRENDWVCLTNDRLLRRICSEHNVRTRWGLELMLDLVSEGALSASRALAAAERIHANNPHHISREVLRRFSSRLQPGQ